MTPEFEENLRKYMKLRKCNQKSEAVRRAVAEIVELLTSKEQVGDFRELLGIGLREPQNPRPKFSSEDDLWS